MLSSHSSSRTVVACIDSAHKACKYRSANTFHAIVCFAYALRKTCPRRGPAGNEAPAIQPALGVEAAEIFASNVAPALPGAMTNGHTHLAVTRIQPCKLDAALEAANKRVVAADKRVASSTTDQEFEEATAALDSAVRYLEKVASCAQRCAMIAHTLSGGTWETPERETKRMRMDGTSTPNALTPTAITLNDGNATATAEAVDNTDAVSGEAKEEPLE